MLTTPCIYQNHTNQTKKPLGIHNNIPMDAGKYQNYKHVLFSLSKHIYNAALHVLYIIEEYVSTICRYFKI